jgi:arabinose-5-phosphate isomerase
LYRRARSELEAADESKTLKSQGLQAHFWCLCAWAPQHTWRQAGPGLGDPIHPYPSRMNIATQGPALAATEPLALARWVFEQQVQALQATAVSLDGRFADAVQLLHQRVPPAKVVVTGVGKSGHIGRKIAATLSSTGTPAVFMHPSEAAHGDLGLLTTADVLLGISYSGESAEVLALLPYLHRHALPVIAITGKPQSTLATAADIHLALQVPQEACPLGLAPTSSTTATLVLGDALAVALLAQRGFTRDQFAITHPAGALGRRLLVRLADVMLPAQQAPAVRPDTPIRQAIMDMSRGGMGLTAITDAQGLLLGIFTDGDLRRALEAGLDIYSTPVGQVMSHQPAQLRPEQLAAAAAQLMQARKSNAVLVSDAQGHYLGAVNWRMLLQAGVV